MRKPVYDPNPTEREILRVIIEYYNMPISRVNLAEEAGCSDRTVYRALKRMEKAEVINIQGPGGRRADSYTINVEVLSEEICGKLGIDVEHQPNGTSKFLSKLDKKIIQFIYENYEDAWTPIEIARAVDVSSVNVANAIGRLIFNKVLIIEDQGVGGKNYYAISYRHLPGFLLEELGVSAEGLL